MPIYNIFIAHSSRDEQLARKICNTLLRVNEFRPYLAQDYPSYGESFKERIQNAIFDCNYFIVLLTENGISSQWVNQEIGFAFGVKKRKKNFYIIPLSYTYLQLKGFITKDSEDLLYIDKYDFGMLAYNILYMIRSTIPNGFNDRTLKIKVTCNSCKTKLGTPYIFTDFLPSLQDINSSIEEKNIIWWFQCNQCQSKNNINILTFEKA